MLAASCASVRVAAGQSPTGGGVRRRWVAAGRMWPRKGFRGLWLVLALLASGCAGGDGEEPQDEAVQPAGAASGLTREVEEGFDPFTSPSLSGLDVQRLAEAVATLDPDAVCPEPVLPESYVSVVEVARIEGGCAVVEYEVLGERSIEEVVGALASDPSVFAVGAPATNIVPQVLQPAVEFDDPLLPQWHLETMDVDRLWNVDGWVRPSGVQVRSWPVSSRVTVAVIDDGVDGSHRDLALRVSRVGDDCHREPLGDHGTHVAGIVSAVQGNNQDTAGVAPYATILSVKIHFYDNYVNWATRTGPDDETCHKIIPTLTQAIDRARLAGADVVNMSLRWIAETDYHFLYDRAREEYGSDEQGPFEGLLSYIEAVTSEPGRFGVGVDTVEWAIRVAQMQGVIFVAAAGNCGNNQNETIDGVTDLGWRHNECRSHNQQQPPAMYPGVIAVAATDSDGIRARFSTSNVDVDIAAPGAGILSTVRSYTAGSVDPCPAGTTCHVQYFDGTSMASPMVAAVVAHMKGRHPEATLRQITDALEITANDKGQGRTNDLGHGIVEPAAALEHLARQFEDEERIPAVGAPSGDSPVVLVVGDSAQDLSGCASRHCAHLQITLEGAVADDYQVACWSSLDPDQPWHIDTWHWPTSRFWSEDGCWFGVPGEQVWVTVNGIKSNTVTWPAASSAAPGEVTGLAYDPATGKRHMESDPRCRLVPSQ